MSSAKHEHLSSERGEWLSECVKTFCWSSYVMMVSEVYAPFRFGLLLPPPKGTLQKQLWEVRNRMTATATKHLLLWMLCWKVYMSRKLNPHPTAALLVDFPCPAGGHTPRYQLLCVAEKKHQRRSKARRQVFRSNFWHLLAPINIEVIRNYRNLNFLQKTEFSYNFESWHNKQKLVRHSKSLEPFLRVVISNFCLGHILIFRIKLTKVKGVVFINSIVRLYCSSALSTGRGIKKFMT